MERKKTPGRRTSRKRSSSARKRKKMTPAEFRMNLILLALIVGVSAAVFCIRFKVQSPVVPASSGVSRSLETERNSSVSLKPAPPAEKAPVPSSGADPESPIAESPAEKAPVPDAAVPSSTQSAPLESVAFRTSPAVEKPGAAEKPVILGKPSSARKPEPVQQKAPLSQKPAVPEKTASRTSSPEKIIQTLLIASAPPPERPHPVKHRGMIIFVFDDAGHNLKQLAPFLKLPFPCTIAVLPGLQYSGEAARRIRAAGKEAMLHQPMQALNLSIDPGPGAIRMGMTPEQIKALVRKNLAEVGPVAGLNNHEGSLITTDRASMEAVLSVVREKGIYFLDSRTNAATVAPAIARETNMTIWERAVFLDNSQDRSSIIEAVNSGMKIAERKGAAIMIGHIWSNDLAEILTGMYPELVSQGFSLSTIAQIATDKEGEE